jgi:hypothetical protein
MFFTQCSEYPKPQIVTCDRPSGDYWGEVHVSTAGSVMVRQATFSVEVPFTRRPSLGTMMFNQFNWL